MLPRQAQRTVPTLCRAIGSPTHTITIVTIGGIADRLWKLNCGLVEQHVGAWAWLSLGFGEISPLLVVGHAHNSAPSLVPVGPRMARRGPFRCYAVSRLPSRM